MPSKTLLAGWVSHTLPSLSFSFSVCWCGVFFFPQQSQSGKKMTFFFFFFLRSTRDSGRCHFASWSFPSVAGAQMTFPRRVSIPGA